MNIFVKNTLYCYKYVNSFEIMIYQYMKVAWQV